MMTLTLHCPHTDRELIPVGVRFPVALDLCRDCQMVAIQSGVLDPDWHEPVMCPSCDGVGVTFHVATDREGPCSTCNGTGTWPNA